MILNVIEGEPEPAEAGPGSLFSERRTGGRAAVRALEEAGRRKPLQALRFQGFLLKIPFLHRLWKMFLLLPARSNAFVKENKIRA